MTIDANSLERLVPGQVTQLDTTGAVTLQLHMERYEFACSHIEGGRILDIACGVGYGSALLCETLPAVTECVGVDLSTEAIDYARREYDGERLQFIQSEAMAFEDVAGRGFDVVVSLETIEHVPDPAGLVSHLLSQLLPGGLFIASVPTTPSVDGNPHHLTDFTERSFRRLFLRHGLEEVDHLLQVQPFSAGSVVLRKEARMENMRSGLPGYYLRHPMALLKRVVSTLRHGFTNRYTTIVWRKPLPGMAEA